MDAAPGASGHVRGGGALLDIPSQAAIHLELDPSRINMRARSFRPAVLEAQTKKSVCGSQEKKCGSLACSPRRGASIAVLFVAAPALQPEHSL